MVKINVTQKRNKNLYIIGESTNYTKSWGLGLSTNYYQTTSISLPPEFPLFLITCHVYCHFIFPFFSFLPLSQPVIYIPIHTSSSVHQFRKSLISLLLIPSRTLPFPIILCRFLDRRFAKEIVENHQWQLPRL